MLTIFQLLFIGSLLTSLGAVTISLVAYWQHTRILNRFQRVERSYLKSLIYFKTLSRALRIVLQTSKAEDLLRELARRRRKRYISFCIYTEDSKPPDPQSLEKTILHAMESLVGILGVSKANPRLVYYDRRNGCGVLRLYHTEKYIALAALGLIREVEGKKTVIIPIKTSGTIKSARRTIPQIWK